MNTSSGSRPMTNAQARQLLATRGGLSSSMGTQAAQGVALGTRLNVSERPVTMQGLRGMKTAGPSRQVYDTSYYVGVLQKKMNELTEEVRKLQGELRTHDAETSAAGGLRRKHEKLLSEVRSLEGTLADYNLAMDKARGGTDPGELMDYVQDFRRKNKESAEEVDRIFVVKKQKDDETRQLEAQIQSLHQQAQRRIEVDLEPAKLKLYNGLVEKSNELVAKRERARGEIDGLNSKIQDLDDGVEASRKKAQAEEYARNLHRLQRLERDERNLREESEVWSDEHSAEDVLTFLKQRVETQSRSLKESDFAFKELKEQLLAMKKQSKDLDEDLRQVSSSDSGSGGATTENGGGGGGGGEKDKYEKLKQRDEEMTSFIRDFDDEKAKCLEETKRTQDTVVALLEHASSGLERGDMPSKEAYAAMKEEATFKERQYESAKETTARLLRDKDQREAELAKIENLDEKIQIELESLHSRMDAMRADVVHFDDLDGLRRQAKATVGHLSRLLKDYQHRKDAVKAQVTQLTAKYDQLKSTLSNSDEHKSLAALEAKLRTYAQTIFHLQEYIETKNRQSDYKPIKDHCTHLVDHLNVVAKKQSLAG